MTGEEYLPPERVQELSDLRTLLRRKDGRRVLRRLLDEAGVLRTTFVLGDSHATSFNEGRRALALWLMAELTEADATLALDVLREAKEQTDGR